jgi:hypothetical protein
MSQPKQFLVYQQESRMSTESRGRHVIVAGPFEDKVQAEAVARAYWWVRKAKTSVCEIGDTQGLRPEPVGCRCDEQAPDPACLIGPYLFERATALGALIDHVGFSYLPTFLQGNLEQQRERWRRKYCHHLLQEHPHEA